MEERTHEVTSGRLTHLLHGQLFEDGVIFVQPEFAEPVQDVVLFRGGGLGLGLGLRPGQTVGLGVRQGLGMGEVVGQGLGTGRTVGRVMVVQVLGVELVLRVGVWMTVLMLLLGGGVTPTRHGALAGQAWQGGGEGGVLWRREGGRKRGRGAQGGEVRSRAGQDRSLGADHRLDTGHPVHRPGGRSRT